jgi:ATP-binding cassette subfamily C protein LapB
MTAMKSRVLSNLVMNFTYTVGIVCTVAIVVWGVYLIGDGKLTLGALIGTVMLSGRALYPIGAIATMAVRFQQARTSLASLNRVMKMPTDREPGREYLIRPIFEGGIELTNVNFKYGPDSPLALSSVALKIQAGEKVAILGRVGSGKSTLLKVIAGLYRAQSGQVLLDGIDVGQIEPANVRRNVIYLGQEAQLFYGSMTENLKAGRPLASDEEMVEAARVCGAHAFISTHPRGYGMTVGEGGGGMSGGQRQAVAAARLLLARPQVMLLDEPTSAMDQATELSVMTALRRAAGNKTMILVTHKLSLLDYVDRVIVLDSGMVVANGPKAEVLKALAEGQVRKALAPTK